jgi:hypothetical protein
LGQGNQKETKNYFRIQVTPFFKYAYFYRWTCIAVAYTEVLVSWKFRKDAGNTLDTPTPMYKWLPWLIGTSFVGLIYIKLRFGSRVTTQYGDSEWERSEKKSRDEFAEEPPQKSKEKKKAKKE